MPEAFIREFERHTPEVLAGRPRRRSVVTNGDRVFLHYDWVGEPGGAVAFVRVQFRPSEDDFWISHLEVHPYHRGRGIGSGIVRAIERGARREGVRFIRLFPRYRVMEFWRGLGFGPDPRSRNFRKAVGKPSPTR